jgi:hypothetical protein
MAVYFDTNVFDHLYKKIGCTSADIANLRKKIYGRELSIPLSIHTLDEILLERGARPERRVARTKLTLSLASFRRMVKPIDQLLTDDIRAYAATGEAARPFIDADLQNIISDGLTELIETDGEHLDEEMVEALDAARANEERFALRIQEVAAEVQQFAAPKSAPDFTQYLEVSGPAFATRLAAHAGVLDECVRRGVEGLLGLRSVKMSVGAILSSMEAQAEERAQPQIFDSKDLLQATSAAAVAETFVSDDRRRRGIVSRVPLEDFEVLDLPAFLQKHG